MTITDILEETYIALSANKVRSGLTMLGIIIGISSVIALIAIGAGAQGTIDASIQSIGSNLLEITPGATAGPGYQVSAGRGSSHTLVDGDATAIEALPDVTAVAEENSGREQVTAPGTNTNVTVDGVTSPYATVRNVAMAEGNFITDENNTEISKVAVIGPTVETDLFGTTDALGQTIVIKGIEFTVIGITVAKGGTSFGSADDEVFIPLSTQLNYLVGSQYLTTVDVEASSAGVMTDLQTNITNLLLARHNISDPTQADFSILNQADIVATASSVTSTFTTLLAAVAGISLVVGGIGIMNMMLTTVTERTREIGLRKAIGARAKDINLQFLIEAIALTFLGGLIGIILGWAIAYGLSYFGVIQASVTLESVLLAFGVSALIGIVFGYYPARRASRLSPIDALRYE